MKITITKEVEVQIEFPSYYKWGLMYYKLISEKEFVCVDTADYWTGISTRKVFIDSFVADVVAKGNSIEPPEFLKAFEETFDKIDLLYATVNPTHRFNQQPEEENGLEESERNEDKINEYYELENQNTE